MNTNFRKLLLILPGVLLFAAWPTSPFTFLIFVALVPFFWMEHHIKNDSRFFLLLYLNLFIWNVATTWWIWNASPGGAIGAIVANSALMCFPWMFYRYSKKQLGLYAGLVAFNLYWVTWEYIHHNWDLSWPWLTLGNVFSTHPNWVQWYEFTGTAGGSVWIILVNMFLYLAIHRHLVLATNQKRKWFVHPKWIFVAAGLLGIPLIISYLQISNISLPLNSTNNIVVVQPNVEAYTEKFNTDPDILIDKMMNLAESRIDEHTRLLVWPETAIPVQVWEHEIHSNRYYQRVFDFTRKHPNIQLLTGIDSYKFWGEKDPGGFSIRTMPNGNHYEAFNTAFATDSSGHFELYHKSKLVPGVESLPSWLGFLSDLFDDLGGTTGSLGKSDSAVVFAFNSNPYQPAPIICYESIYGDYVADYCRKGANVLTVITNDGWWGNTQGYKQHMNMARLRAIENRRWVARSANTGISCFIDPAGNVLDAQPWNKAAAIKLNVPALDDTTFFTKHGDWISRFSWPMAVALGFWSIFTGLRKKPRLSN